jgi:hypothetical protein
MIQILYVKSNRETACECVCVRVCMYIETSMKHVPTLMERTLMKSYSNVISDEGHVS